VIVRVRASLGDQRGQTLVLFAVFMFGLVLLLALVIDVGAWKRAQREAQTVADAASLAGAHELPFDAAGAASAALRYRDLNAPSVTITSDPRGDAMTVTASRDVPALFAKVAGFLNVTVRARATARVVPPARLRNSDLRRISTDTYLAPIVVNERKVCTDPSCFGAGASTTLELDDSDLAGSGFGVICRGSCSGRPGRSALANRVRCNPCIGGDFASSTTESAPALSARNGAQVGNALLSVRNKTLIVPVFADRSAYNIVGFAAFVITAVIWNNDNASCRPGCKQLTGYFTKYTTADNVPDALGNTGTTAPDYGVEVIGLTS
jgi:Flp pilus assembly protein TadG